MDRQQIAKLKRKGLSQRVAGKLVRAGFRTPKLIKAASDEDLMAISDMKAGDVSGIREKIG